jgi:hypothetical protein
LVIVANDITVPTSTVFDALNTYVLGGGRLIIHTWYMGVVPDHGLWETLGVSHAETAYVNPGELAPPVYWWNDTHPIFTIPHQVPEFEQLNNPLYQAWPVANIVNARPGFTELGGYSPDPSENSGAIVIGSGGNTLFRGFVDFINDPYLDGDGNDGVELWINMIVYILELSPGPFNKSNPANNATGQPLNLTLSWGSSVDASNYKYCVDTINNNSCDTSWTSVGSSNSAEPVALNYDTRYYWQVRAFNAFGATEADSGTWWAFSTSTVVFLPLIIR